MYTDRDHYLQSKATILVKDLNVQSAGSAIYLYLVTILPVHSNIPPYI